MALLHYSHRKAASLALGIVILLVLFPLLFNIVFAAKDEISFGAGVGASTCDAFYINEESELSRCTSSFDISLGNTGTNHQKLITIDLASVPETHRLSWNSVDIVATNRESIEPDISYQQLGETLHFEIQNLQPNRVVDIRISSQGVESARKMQSTSVSVMAQGTIVETSPRMTVSLRFLRNLGGIVGF